MRRQHNGVPLGGESGDERAYLGHPGRVEPIGGFIENEQVGPAQQRGGHPEALLHAQ